MRARAGARVEFAICVSAGASWRLAPHAFSLYTSFQFSEHRLRVVGDDFSRSCRTALPAEDACDCAACEQAARLRSCSGLRVVQSLQSWVWLRAAWSGFGDHENPTVASLYLSKKHISRSAVLWGTAVSLVSRPAFSTFHSEQAICLMAAICTGRAG